MWDSIRDGLLSLANQYGVNPVVFGIIWVGTIPLYTAAVGWVVRRLLHGRPYLLPGVLAGLFYLSSYIYIFAVGRNLPIWVYGLMIGLISTGAYFTIRNIRERTGMNPRDCTHDVIVVGGGAAGLTAAALSANLGARTLLVEQQHVAQSGDETNPRAGPRLGGDCTWEGCVPSKTLLKSARVAHHIRHAGAYGLEGQTPALDFGAVMNHVRETRREVFDDADRPERYEAMGVEVRGGHARFLDEHTLEIEQEDGIHTASARYIIVTAGGRAVDPPIEGLSETPHWTSASLFEIDQRPERLAIIGAGPIGTEMAQAFQRLGSQVTVIDQAGRILAKDDAELAGMLRSALEAEGVRYVLNANVKHVRETATGVAVEAREADGEHHTIEADALLVATGRRPNLEELHLEAADVDYTDKGITVSDRCRTSQRHIYAAGDVTGRFQFTHMSEHMAKTAVMNALLKIPSKIDAKRLPWVTYADPELAHVGATEEQLANEGVSYEVYRFPYDKLDRAICERKTTGMIKVCATKWRGKILGASILGARAGDMICEYALAMKTGASLRQVADTIHPYPTFGQGVRRAADQWYVRKQTPRVVRFIKSLFGYRGDVPEDDPDRIL